MFTAASWFQDTTLVSRHAASEIHVFLVSIVVVILTVLVVVGALVVVGIGFVVIGIVIILVLALILIWLILWLIRRLWIVWSWLWVFFFWIFASPYIWFLISSFADSFNVVSTVTGETGQTVVWIESDGGVE